MQDVGVCIIIFFFNDTATTEIYTLSLHDALPIYACRVLEACVFGGMPVLLLSAGQAGATAPAAVAGAVGQSVGSGEHTSELQSRQYLVCRLLLVKKKKHVQLPPSLLIPFLLIPAL